MNYPTLELPSQEYFLRETNGRGHVRLFTASHYKSFREHAKAAQFAAKACLPYYWEDNAGCVGRSYKYAADTARCGVYACPPATSADKEGYVMMVYDRVRCSVNVPCIYRGGERSYRKWFRSKGGYWFT
jgi:hypothetical protein